MAVDEAGNLYFADTGNDRIRKITNADSGAQLGVTTPDNYFLNPATGGDQHDLLMYGTSSQPFVINNVGVGSMAWTASISTLDGGNWLQISAASGSAPSTITVSANAMNLSPGLYWGTILLSASGATNSPRYVSVLLTVPIPFLSSGASSGTFVVYEPANVGWSVSSNVDWISITSQATGNGTGNFTYSVARNPRAQRTGTLTVAGTSITVQQAAASRSIPNPPGPRK